MKKLGHHAHGGTASLGARKARYMLGLAGASLLVACQGEGAADAPTPTSVRNVAALDARFTRFVDPKLSTFEPSEFGAISRGALVTRLPKIAGRAVALSLGDGPTFRISMRLEGAAPSAAEQEGGIATYRGIFPGTDLIASATDASAELLLTLRDEEAPSHFSFLIETSSTFPAPSFDPQGNLVFSTIDSTGKQQTIVIPAPVAIDAAGVRHSASMTFEDGEDGSHRLAISFEHQGLPHPVLLDPGATIWNFRQREIPSARWGHSGAFDTRRNRVVFTGGRGVTTQFPGDTLEWDGFVMDRFPKSSPLGGTRLGRGGSGTIFDAKRGKTVVFAGYRDGYTFDDLWEYDGRAWTLIPVTGAQPARRGLPAMAYDPSDGSYLVYGGLDFSTLDLSSPIAGAASILASLKHDTWKYLNGTWTQLSSTTSVGNLGSNLVYDGANHRFLLFGGTIISGFIAGGSNTVSTLNQAGAWVPVKTTGTPPSPRVLSTAVWDSDLRRIVIVGGADGLASLFADSNTSVVYSDSFSLADPDGDGTYAWTRLGNLSHVTSSAGGAYDSARKQVVLYGGATAANVFTGALDVLTQDTWTSVSGLTPSARVGATMGWDASSKSAILFGGNDGTNRLGETWRWDGRSWSQVTGTPQPAGREDAAGTAVADGFLLHGGETQAGINDTWIFRNNQWQQLTVGTPPSLARRTSIGYDPVRNVVVRFGGQDAVGEPVAETWEFQEATGWKRMTPAASPPAEWGASIQYFPGKGLILVGGKEKGIGSSSSWLYEGAPNAPTWKKLSAGGLSKRQKVTMAYDQSRKQFVLVGGRTDGPTDDFFTFEGTTWTDQSGAVALLPPPRERAAMAYDPIRQQTVIFGGEAESGTGTDTVAVGDTWLLGASGYGCTTDAECGGLFCTDGVCCAARECSTCETCAGEKTLGVCAPVAVNLPDEGTCSGPGQACDGARQCAKSLGSPCTLDAECGSGACVDGVCCNTRCQDKCMVCGGDTMASGTPGTCSPEKRWACAQTCTTAQDCVAPQVCSSGNKCIDPHTAPDADGCVVTPAPSTPGFGTFFGLAVVGTGLLFQRRRNRNGRAAKF